jgi:hypothetical protein
MSVGEYIGPFRPPPHRPFSEHEIGHYILPSVNANCRQGGREIAATQRPQTKGPPIAIVSDGTVF